MGSCVSTPTTTSPSTCSAQDMDEYQWLLDLQEHRINQLRMSLRQQESENARLREEVEGPGSAPGANVLRGVALRYGQAHAVQDTRQLLRDLAVLNFYQRHVLDTLACIPVHHAPARRVRFD